jgi:hypothetical protein
VQVQYASERAEELSRKWQICADCGRLFPAHMHRHRCRTCPGDAPIWAADQRQRFFRNDEQYVANLEGCCPGLDRGYLEVVTTAPGTDAGLVWDEARCKIAGPHVHSGDDGCRVVQAAADLWNERSLEWWSLLHEAAQERTRRAVGARAYVVFKIPEEHKRGVRHGHSLLGYTTPLERSAADFYVDTLRELAPSYGFGFVLPARRREAGTGAGAAYFASYFIDGKGRKAAITEAVQSKVLDGCTIYVSPRLTMRSGITMRALRLRRYLWHHIGSGGIRLADHLGLGMVEVYELYERGFWGPVFLNMLIEHQAAIE